MSDDMFDACDKMPKKRGRKPRTPEQKAAAVAKRRESEREAEKRYRSQAVSPVIAPMTSFIGDAQNEDDFTARAIALNMEIANRPKCDLFNPDQVREYINEYFMIFQKYGLKPTIAGLALMLGTNRQRIYDMKTGISQHGKPVKYPEETVEMVRSVYQMLENMMEAYSLSGKINPVMAIFHLKNHHGYRDSQEYVVTPNTDSQDKFNAEDLKNRYLTDDSIDSELSE